MEKIFFTSDTHFLHDRDFVWQVRGFNSVQEMNEEIVKRWNEAVSPEDTVYHLGDVMLGKNEEAIEYVKQLNGKIYLALGNHDTAAREKLYKECSNIVDVQLCYRIKKGKKSIILSHYPTIVANGDDTSVINFYGHTHQTDNFYDNKPYMYHVGMDSHNCQPVEIEEIFKEIRTKKESIKNGD